VCLAVKGKVEAVSERNVVVAEAVVEVVVGAAQDPLGGVFMFHGAGVLKTIRPCLIGEKLLVLVL